MRIAATTCIAIVFVMIGCSRNKSSQDQSTAVESSVTVEQDARLFTDIASDISDESTEPVGDRQIPDVVPENLTRSLSFRDAADE
ncbi:MAG: hypothetical protein NXI28_09055, partial [bacterium]|nr:hypothetical protein [bacterium]